MITNLLLYVCSLFNHLFNALDIFTTEFCEYISLINNLITNCNIFVTDSCYTQ